jgi:hypothetical protein
VIACTKPILSLKKGLRKKALKKYMIIKLRRNKKEQISKSKTKR